MSMYLSLVIPVFNEEKRLPKNLPQIIKYLKKQNYSWEIIVINDGSIDRTEDIAKKLLKNIAHQLVGYADNKGKGAAVKTGILLAKGKYIVFTDIDLSTPISELPKILQALKTHEIAIGVRRHPQSQVIRHQPFLREFLGQIFTKLTNYLVAPGIYDVTCGFKGFQKEAAYRLFRKSTIEGWAFDAEIIFLARKNKYRIAQIPVTWRNDPATRVKMLHDGLQSFFDLIKIRFFS